MPNAKHPAQCWVWAQSPPVDVRPSDHPHGVCLSRHMHIHGLLEVILQCSSCSSSHKGAGSGTAARLLPSYSLFYISWCTGMSPISTSQLWTLLTDTVILFNTACIEPSWISCTIWATSVGCRLCLMLPLEWKHDQHSKVTKTSARNH